MKNTCTFIILLLLACTAMAQNKKPCLFIGLYDGNKRGICSDREMVYEDIEDYFDYLIKRKAFDEAHKTQNPNTRFIDAKESVIAYRYQKKMAGWSCSSSIIGIKTAKSIEDCNKQLADHLTRHPNDFTTSPLTYFTWQGKGENQSVYTKDFGGVSASFLSVKSSTGKDLIRARFRNKLKDKTAILILQTDAGMVAEEYIKPGELLTKSFDTKKLEIQIIYKDFNAPLPTFKVMEFIKDMVREKVINENGVIKSTRIGAVGVRG